MEQVECQVCKNWTATGFADGVARKDLVREREEIDKQAEHRKTHEKHHKGNGAPNGAFAFTLTMSPADNLTASDLLVAARKIMSQKSNKVKRYAWYYEDKGKDAEGVALHPHIHGMYETETGGRIHSKHFQRAWKIWDEKKPMGQGFRGGYHRLVKSEEGYELYIQKSNMFGEKMFPPSIEDAPRPTQPETVRNEGSPGSDTCPRQEPLGGAAAPQAWRDVRIREESVSDSSEEGGNEICG